MTEGAHRGQTELTYVRRRSQSSGETHRRPREVIGILEIQRKLTEVRRRSWPSHGAQRGHTELTEA